MSTTYKRCNSHMFTRKYDLQCELERCHGGLHAATDPGEQDEPAKTVTWIYYSPDASTMQRFCENGDVNGQD